MATLVGSPVNNVGAASSTTIAATYGSAAAVGDVILVQVHAYHDTATVTGVADNLGTPTTYSQVGSLLRTANDSPFAFMTFWVGPVITAGTPTVTATFSTGSTERYINVYIWRGCDTSNPVNQTNGTTGQVSGGGPTTILSGQIITTTPGPIVKGMVDWDWVAKDHAAGTPSTGWTEFGDQGTSGGGDSAYRIETATGTFNGGFIIQNNGDPWACRIVALADAAAAGGATRSHHFTLLGVGH